jgi:hypothetical protein
MATVILRFLQGVGFANALKDVVRVVSELPEILILV